MKNVQTNLNVAMNVTTYLAEMALCITLFYFGHHTAGLWATFLTLFFGGCKR